MKTDLIQRALNADKYQQPGIIVELVGRIAVLEEQLRVAMDGIDQILALTRSALPPRITTHCKTMAQCGTYGCTGACKI